MPNIPKPATLKKVNRLICEGRWIAGNTYTIEFALEDVATAVRFREKVVDVLLDLGPGFDDLRHELSGIPAVKTGTTWDFNHEGEPLGRSSVDLVDARKIRRMVSYLIKARRRLDAKGGANGQSGGERKRPGQTAQVSYSAADEKLYRSIGAERFRTLPNAELSKLYRTSASKHLERRITPDAFRAICDRVRRHHGFPKSNEIRMRRRSS